MSALYDRIGRGYVRGRRADPRIAAAVDAALAGARSVLNVGAGAGASEPVGRCVLAVEPAAAMRAQRPPDGAACIDAAAEDLPLPDASFDAALATYSDFHWTDLPRGITEMVRVSRSRVVLLTVDRSVAERYWLTRLLPRRQRPVRRALAPDCRAPGPRDRDRSDPARLPGRVRARLVAPSAAVARSGHPLDDGAV